MALRMPRWDLLDQNEQMPVINMPLDNPLWVQGGPGTGKTVLALYRAAQVTHAAENYQVKVGVLSYNKTLQLYITEALAAAQIVGVEATTWHSWLYRTYYRLFDKRVPQLQPYTPDWDSVGPMLLGYFERYGPVFHHLFIDEAQDLPARLLPILHAAARQVTVFSDPNQQIHEDVVEHSEIGPLLGITNEVYYLSRNYRNTAQISEVAKLLQVKEIEQVKQPVRSGRKPTVVKASGVSIAYDYLATYIDNNRDLSIGVLGYSYSAVCKAFQEIGARVSAVNVQVYRSGGKADFDIGLPGVKILSFATAKGLEFDTVVIPALQEARDPDERIALDSNRAYVAATRARDDLMFLVTDRSASYIFDRLSTQPEMYDLVKADGDEMNFPLEADLPF